MRRVLITLVSALLVPLALPGATWATFPGRNGRIAFVRAEAATCYDDTGAPRTVTVWMVLASGRGLRRVAFGPELAYAWLGGWSPTGSALALRLADCAAEGVGQSFVRADGRSIPGLGWGGRGYGAAVTGWLSRSRVLGDADLGAGSSVWSMGLKPSSDGYAWGDHAHLIARHAESGTASARGTVAFVRGGTIRLLLPGHRSHHLVGGGQPDWAPDSRRIAYVRGGDLWIIDTRTRRVRRLTRTPAVKERHPVWSPDGREVAYDSNGSIAIIPSRGGSPRTLVADGRSPSWQPRPPYGALHPACPAYCG